MFGCPCQGRWPGILFVTSKPDIVQNMSRPRGKLETVRTLQSLQQASRQVALGKIPREVIAVFQCRAVSFIVTPTYSISNDCGVI